MWFFFQVIQQICSMSNSNFFQTPKHLEFPPACFFQNSALRRLWRLVTSGSLQGGALPSWGPLLAPAPHRDSGAGTVLLGKRSIKSCFLQGGARPSGGPPKHPASSSLWTSPPASQGKWSSEYKCVSSIRKHISASAADTWLFVCLAP